MGLFPPKRSHIIENGIYDTKPEYSAIKEKCFASYLTLVYLLLNKIKKNNKVNVL